MDGTPPDSHGVHITGDFQTAAGYPGGNWLPNTTQMINEPGTEIYSVVVDIPAFAKYEYKIINANATYGLEFVPIPSRVNEVFNDNRWIYIDSLSDDTTFFGAIRFSGNAPKGKYLLRYKVDMLNEVISLQGVHLSATVQGLNPATTYMYSFGLGVHEYIAYIDSTASGIQQDYKFVNGNSAIGYEFVPNPCSNGSNFRTTLVPNDSVLPVVCYSSCTTCVPLSRFLTSQKENISLFPNPASENVWLEFSEEGEHDVCILDMNGKVVADYKKYNNNRLFIQAQLFSPGLYIVNISGRDYAPSKLKLVIE